MQVLKKTAAKVILTGASRGIGQAAALLFADRGAQLALLARSSEALDQTLEEVRARGAEAVAIPCDLEDPVEITTAAEHALAALGGVDVLVNNAGTIHRRDVQSTTLLEWDAQFAVNVRAPFLLTQAVLPAMLLQRHGNIVHVGSISATLGTARAAAYCGSKWALIGFMKSLAEELHDTGVSTVAILPGSVDTRMLAGSGFAPSMSPRDVAETLVYFSLDAPRAHNGGVIEMFGT